MQIDSVISFIEEAIKKARDFDVYPAVRPLLFKLDPEKAHELTITLMEKGIYPRYRSVSDKVLNVKICGLDFPNPLGLAAGFDKQAQVMGEVLDLGFGFTEVGSILPQPQPGNPRPRLFRIPPARAVINRFGFNSDGMEVCVRRIAAWRDTVEGQKGLLGINVGKNKETADAVTDYVAGVKAFAPLADYLTVNISSPNTPGLRDLQGREEMGNLLKQVMAVRNEAVRKPPVFVKVAPDLVTQQEEDIAEVALASGVDGIIIGNTTISRTPDIPAEIAKEQGGLSGAPLFSLSTQLLGRMYKRLGGKIPLIGCGGVSNGADAYAKIRAGASLVQLYTALIYEGPAVVTRIKRELAFLLRRDGFASVSEAVGADNK